MGDEFIVPEGAISSQTAYFWLDEHGIICICNKEGVLHGGNDATENIGVAYEMRLGISRPLLIDLSNVKSMSRTGREIYAASGAHYTAIALVTNGPVSKVLANFFIGFNKPVTPTRVFNNHAAAKKWLFEHMEI